MHMTGASAEAHDGVALFHVSGVEVGKAEQAAQGVGQNGIMLLHAGEALVRGLDDVDAVKVEEQAFHNAHDLQKNETGGRRLEEDELAVHESVYNKGERLEGKLAFCHKAVPECGNDGVLEPVEAFHIHGSAGSGLFGDVAAHIGHEARQGEAGLFRGVRVREGGDGHFKHFPEGGDLGFASAEKDVIFRGHIREGIGVAASRAHGAAGPLENRLQGLAAGRGET